MQELPDSGNRTSILLRRFPSECPGFFLPHFDEYDQLSPTILRTTNEKRTSRHHTRFRLQDHLSVMPKSELKLTGASTILAGLHLQKKLSRWQKPLTFAECHFFNVAPDYFELIISENLSKPFRKWSEPARWNFRQRFVCRKQDARPDFATTADTCPGRQKKT